MKNLNPFINTYVNMLLMLFLQFLIAHQFSFDLTADQWYISLLLPLLPTFLKGIQDSHAPYLNTRFGTFLKYGLMAAIGFLINKGTLVGWPLKELGTAILTALLPLFVNNTNPLYKHYGYGKSE